MKKTLIIAISSAILFTGCSNTESSNVKSSNANTATPAMNNTHIANKYNRENSVSTGDIQNLGNDYNSVLAVAKAEQGKAKKVEGEWNTIRKLMKKAKKDHNAGNDDAAIKKLNKAIIHARLGVKQAADQANAGPRF